jgi:hypothetical protein
MVRDTFARAQLSHEGSDLRGELPVYEVQPTTRCSSSFEIIDNFGFVLSEIQLKVEKHGRFA